MSPTNRLRIVHLLSHDRVRSGGAVQALLLAREQRDRGHDVRIVYNAGRNPSDARAEFGPIAAGGLLCEPVSMQGIRAAFGRLRFRRLMNQWHPEILHAHRERALCFAQKALRGSDTPALVAQKGNCNRSKAGVARTFRSARTARIIAVAQAVKDVLVEQDGVAADKIEVVYGSFDSRRFSAPVDRSPVRRELGVPETTQVVGILANLDRKKSHGDFFHAAKRVLANHCDVHFAVVGGGDQAPLRRLAEEFGVVGHTTFLGFRADVECCLAAFDVSVNCSRSSEGLTGALRESLAAGRPVVCTDVGGNRELIEEGVTGHIVTAGDTDALADAILKMIGDKDHAARLAGAGRDRVLSRMNTATRTDQVMQIYRDVLDAPALAAPGATAGR